MEKRLKSWQGWLLFGGSMVVVFVLGLCVSALMERRAELASVFNNRKTVIEGIEARNEVFKSDFPRETNPLLSLPTSFTKFWRFLTAWQSFEKGST